jgi:hypothetical protein
MANYDGKCLCGAVRFHAEVDHSTHGACHCGMCRRWSGGSPFFSVPTTSVSFEGEENVGRYASSGWAERGFCKTCGSALFYYLKPMSRYIMSAGAFDDQGAFKLASEIYIDRKPDGYSLAGDHPRLTEAETIARYMPKSS